MNILDRMIDATAVCIRCRQLLKAGCHCYVRCRCPTCRRTLLTVRQGDDPPDLAEMIFPCPTCQQDDALPRYLDAHGGEIPYEVMHP